MELWVEWSGGPSAEDGRAGFPNHPEPKRPMFSLPLLAGMRSSVAAALFLPALLCLTPLTGRIDLVIDHGRRFQEIEGIGTSTRNADSYMRQAVHQDYYVQEFGASMFRVFMDYGSLDFTANAASITKDRLLLKESSIENNIKIGLDLKRRHPSIRLIGSFWTPPAWMKQNGSVSGTDANTNRLLPQYEMHYARFLAAWVELMRDHFQTPLYGLSIQNELRFPQAYASCVWEPDQYYRVIKELVRLLKERELEVILFGPEDMTQNFPVAVEFLRPIMDDPELVPYFQVAASHGYTNGVQGDNNPASADQFRLRVTEPLGLRFWMTETSGAAHSWEEGMVANYGGGVSLQPGALDGVAAPMHFAFTGGNASAFVYWLANHESTLHGEELFEQMVPQKKSYAFQHYSQLVRPGAYRVEAVPVNQDQVNTSAYAHSGNGTLTLVILNRSSTAQTVSIRFKNETGVSAMSGFQTTATANYVPVGPYAVGDGASTFSLPARSITTLQGVEGSFAVPTYTLEAEAIEVPLEGGEFQVSVSVTDPDFIWTAESAATWVRLLHGAEFTGPQTVTLTVSRKTSPSPRTTTVRLGDALLSVTQRDIPPPPQSIFEGSSVVNYGQGIKYNVLGFFYDGAYPFVFLWETGQWIYLWPDGASLGSFYFYHFGRAHWGWSANSFLPYYQAFDGTEELVSLTDPDA